MPRCCCCSQPPVEDAPVTMSQCGKGMTGLAWPYRLRVYHVPTGRVHSLWATSDANRILSNRERFNAEAPGAVNEAASFTDPSTGTSTSTEGRTGEATLAPLPVPAEPPARYTQRCHSLPELRSGREEPQVYEVRLRTRSAMVASILRRLTCTAVDTVSSSAVFTPPRGSAS